MKKPVFLLVMFLLACMMSFSTFGQETAEDVVIKMNKYGHGSSCKLIQKIEIIRPDWKRNMTVKLWTKDGTKFAVMLIKEPVRDKGISFLKRSSEAWNWQPSIERTIKLPPSVMMQSWMGSDITNDDMIKLSSIVADYTHKFLKDTVIESHNCYAVEALPKEDASVIWGKVELYITKDSYITLLQKSYDEDGELVRIVRGHDIKQYGDRLHVSWEEVIPKNKTGQKTVSRMVEIAWDVPINENFFSILNLKKLE